MRSQRHRGHGLATSTLFLADTNTCYARSRAPATDPGEAESAARPPVRAGHGDVHAIAGTDKAMVEAEAVAGSRRDVGLDDVAAGAFGAKLQFRLAELVGASQLRAHRVQRAAREAGVVGVGRARLVARRRAYGGTGVGE
jgi:hypothetical protein